MSAPIEIPGYQLERLVARGTFSEVWFAQRESAPAAEPHRGAPSGRPEFAAKIATGEVGARMLRAEAALYRRMDGLEGIPRLVDFSGGRGAEPREFEQDGEMPWLVLDWLGDRSFRDVLRGIASESDRGRALAEFLDIVRVMAAVHRLGVAHGDLKPENVMIRPGKGTLTKARPVILDFGLAREFQKERLGARLSESLKTKSGLEGGTLAYLPPEAVKGAEPSPAGDVYALGVILHEALLGRRPDKATSPEALRKLLDPAVVEILCKALAFEPTDRYAHARELLDALREHERALTATGLSSRARSAYRFGLAGLAAFFVALRYTSVAGLLGLYAFLAISPFFVGNPAPLLAFLPCILLHAVIRWEGPETPLEASLRQKKLVVNRAGGRRR